MADQELRALIKAFRSGERFSNAARRVFGTSTDAESHLALIENLEVILGKPVGNKL